MPELTRVVRLRVITTYRDEYILKVPSKLTNDKEIYARFVSSGVDLEEPAHARTEVGWEIEEDLDYDPQTDPPLYEI